MGLKKDDPTLRHEEAVYSESKPVPLLSKENGGLKYDANKPRLDLLPCSALMEMGKVMAFGATKYDAHNWRKGLVWSRCAAAALRHIFQWLGGETNDRESGLNHLAHAGVNICFLLEYAQSKPELDDRFKK